MDPKTPDMLRHTLPWGVRQLTVRRLMMTGCVTLLLSGVLLTSCQRDNVTQESDNTVAPETPVSSDTVPADNNVEQAPPPSEPAPGAITDTTAVAPNSTDTAQAGATLPDTLTRQWEPASNVLFTFGSMTITPDQVQWSSGQSSSYTVVSTDQGYLLKLEANPVLYETETPYIQLMPQTNDAGETTSVDVAFYESDAQAASNDYIMYGSYFVE